MQFSFLFGVIFFVLTLLLACGRLRRYKQTCSNSVAREESSAGVTVAADVTDDDEEINLRRGSEPVYSKRISRSSSMLNNPFSSSSSCSICLKDYKESDKLRLLPDCGHVYHLRCIDPWLSLHPTCPLCRTSSSSSSSAVTNSITIASSTL